MLVCRLSADSELRTKRSTIAQEAVFEDNYFGKGLLISVINNWNSLSKHCIF